MEIYYAPVLFALAALTAQVARSRELDTLALVTFAFATMMIAGLRWYADVDYAGYVEMYNDTPHLRNFNAESIRGLYGEAGYLLLNAAGKSLGLEFFLIAFAGALSSVILKSFVIYRLSRHASLAICLYLSLHFVTIEIIQMRWAIATGLIALGFYFQYKQRMAAAFLSFACSLAFHYFSVIFWVVAIVVGAGGYRRFQVLFIASILAALFLRIEFVAPLIMSDSEVYALQRLTRYASDPTSSIGMFSYAKLLMYPAVYAACVHMRPDFPWTTDRRNLFLYRVSLACISATLIGSFLPVIHQRATVVTDVFAIIWILNGIAIAFSGGIRLLAFAGLTALFCTWQVIDVGNYIAAGRVFVYHTWLTALR